MLASGTPPRTPLGKLLTLARHPSRIFCRLYIFQGWLRKNIGPRKKLRTRKKIGGPETKLGPEFFERARASVFTTLTTGWTSGLVISSLLVSDFIRYIILSASEVNIKFINCYPRKMLILFYNIPTFTLLENNKRTFFTSINSINTILRKQSCPARGKLIPSPPTSNLTTL